MQKYCVAVVGATGLVGRKMLQLLEERNFPTGELIPLASAASAGSTLSFAGKEVVVRELNENSFEGVDLALFSAGGNVSKTYAPIAAAAGAVVVDNSSAWRMDSTVPLVVPEVNPHALSGHSGIIANPNCSTIQMVVALQPLKRFGIKRLVVSTYQGVTGSGKKAVLQLEQELAGKPVDNPAYPHPIANNCLPHIDRFFEDGYTREEHKMVHETRKIMETANLPVSATCVRIPVIGGHSESINIEFDKPFEMQEILNALNDAPGIVVTDTPSEDRYPMPLTAHEDDAVFVGRIRRDPSVTHGINMWVVSDNLRKGAATNTIQIAELLVKQGLLRIRRAG